MGTILYTMYAAQIADITWKHGLKYHFYADDTQIYIFFDRDRMENAVSPLEVCVSEIRTSMKPNILKLSDDKTELLRATRKGFREMPFSPSTTIGDCCSQPAKQVRNLGVMFDEHMTMGAQVSAVPSSAHFHLRNIGTIRGYLTEDPAVYLVPAFISSRLDQGNALLYGVPKY